MGKRYVGIDKVSAMAAGRRSGSVGRAGYRGHTWRTSDGKSYPVTVRRVAMA